MKKIIWEVQYLSLPPILKYCKKCRKKMGFICSKQFRINAQRRYLDIWLIYKCSNCDNTWNAPIYSRVSPQSLNHDLLDCFYKNDETLVEHYAMKSDFLSKNGVEVGIPLYSVVGDSFSPNEAIELEIKSKHPFAIKISTLVRDKLHLSQKEYKQLVVDRKIESSPYQDLQKCKLKKEIVLVFNRREVQQ